MSGHEDELDDLLSSFEPEAGDSERRPTEALGDVLSESMPAIRTPIAPSPPPAEPPPEAGENSDAFQLSNYSRIGDTDPPPIFEDPIPGLVVPPAPRGLAGTPLPLSNDLDAAFALAEAEAEIAPPRSLPIDVSPTPEEVEPISAVRGTGEPFSAPAPRGLPAIFWVAIISFAVAGLGAILYSQIEAFHPERQEGRDRLSDGEKDRALAAHRRSQPVPGTATIRSAEADAAIWVLLGRTPLESIIVPSDQVHEVRFELTGRDTLDATIDRTHWREGETQRATLSVSLAKGNAQGPAYPPERAVKPPPGPAGRGTLVLASDPPGARAWLLIGFTPEAKLSGIETGRRYEFRVTKDGFYPGYAVVEESDWSSGRTEAERTVALTAAKTARK